MVALLSGMYRNSQRMVQSGMADLFGISMSLGSVNKLRLEASKAVANCVYEAKRYVQQQACVGADETGFHQEISTVAIPKNVKLGYGLRPHPSHIF